MKNKYKIHILFWLLFIVFQINSEYAYLSTFLAQHLRLSNWTVFYYAILSILVFDLSIIPCFYLVLAVVDNGISFLRTTLTKLVAVIGAVVFFVITFRISCHFLVYEILYEVPESIDSFSIFGVFNALMNIGFGVSLAMGIEKFRQQLVLQDEYNALKNEKLASEIRFLKHQINPHFLFNTLNNIYGLALKKSDETPDVILRLAKIMRYNIYESSNEWVTLDKEVQNIEDYIAIYKLRYVNLVLHLDFLMEDKSVDIAPLILLQFVENAFKYGVYETYEQAYIRIFLHQKKDEIVFSVKNSICENRELFSTKIGLQNIEKQLQLLYPNRHTLEIKSSNKDFFICLKLKINEK